MDEAECGKPDALFWTPGGARLQEGGDTSRRAEPVSCRDRIIGVRRRCPVRRGRRHSFPELSARPRGWHHGLGIRIHAGTPVLRIMATSNRTSSTTRRSRALLLTRPRPITSAVAEQFALTLACMKTPSEVRVQSSRLVNEVRQAPLAALPRGGGCA